MAQQKQDAKKANMKNTLSKNAYLLTKPFSTFTDKEWKAFTAYLGTPECKEDIRNANFNN